MVLPEGDSATAIERWFFVPWLSKFAEEGGVSFSRTIVPGLRTRAWFFFDKKCSLKRLAGAPCCLTLCGAPLPAEENLSLIWGNSFILASFPRGSKVDDC